MSPVSERPPPEQRGPLARLLASEPVHIAELDPRSVTACAGLFAEEVRAVASAVESRQKQYTAGRVLARRAWAELGVASMPLLSDEQRVPRWPEGVVGCITHTLGWCAAAVGRAEHVAALGVDVEAATVLDVDLWERICRPEERVWLQAHAQPAAGLLAKALFSAKESIYKALYPHVRVFLDFQAMHIALSPGAEAGTSRWQATLQVPWGPFAAGQRFEPGWLSIDPSWVLTGVVLSPEAIGLAART
jgi:4'-phosphopantetheinyl transferase EntD